MAAFVKISPISLPSCPLFPNSPMSLVPNLGAHFSSYIVCNCWLQTIYSHELEPYQRSTTRCPLCLPVVLAGRPHLCTSTSHELSSVSPSLTSNHSSFVFSLLLPSPATLDIYPSTLPILYSFSLNLHIFLCVSPQSLQEKRKRSTINWASIVL